MLTQVQLMIGHDLVDHEREREKVTALVIERNDHFRFVCLDRAERALECLVFRALDVVFDQKLFVCIIVLIVK